MQRTVIIIIANSSEKHKCDPSICVPVSIWYCQSALPVLSFTILSKRVPFTISTSNFRIYLIEKKYIKLLHTNNFIEYIFKKVELYQYHCIHIILVLVFGTVFFSSFSWYLDIFFFILMEITNPKFLLMLQMAKICNKL